MKRCFIFIFMSAVFLSACSTSRWVPTPVLSEQNFTVTLEHYMDEDQIIKQNYDHPYNINPLTLKKFLTDLVYIEESGFWEIQTENPVFQEIEVDHLLPALAQAMADATPDQRIHFISYNKIRRLLFSNRQKTEGVIFIEPGNRLNIAFAHINVEIDPENNQVLPESITQVDPLKVASSDTFLLPPPRYAAQQTDNNGESIPMWIVANLDKFQANQTSTPKPLPQGKAPNTSLKTTTETGKIQAKPAAELQNRENQYERIRNKLAYLKKLYEDGLISKQDYEAKKKEILDDF